MRYLSKGTELQFKKGQIIYHEGDDIGEHAIFYVISGSVLLKKRMSNGVEFTYSLAQDDTFGVVSTMANQPREQDAVAQTDVKLYCWTLEGFENAVNIYIEFARMSIQHLSRYMRVVHGELLK